MKQDRLNYLMLLHIHKDKTDKLDLKTILNEFISFSNHRSNIFTKLYPVLLLTLFTLKLILLLPHLPHLLPGCTS